MVRVDFAELLPIVFKIVLVLATGLFLLSILGTSSEAEAGYRGGNKSYHSNYRKHSYQRHSYGKRQYRSGSVVANPSYGSGGYYSSGKRTGKYFHKHRKPGLDSRRSGVQHYGYRHNGHQSRNHSRRYGHGEYYSNRTIHHHKGAKHNGSRHAGKGYHRNHSTHYGRNGLRYTRKYYGKSLVIVVNHDDDANQNYSSDYKACPGKNNCVYQETGGANGPTIIRLGHPDAYDSPKIIVLDKISE